MAVAGGSDPKGGQGRPRAPSLELAWLLEASAEIELETTRSAAESGDEVWFSAEELARSSEVELGRDPVEAGGLVPPMDAEGALTRRAAQLRPFADGELAWSAGLCAALAQLGPGRSLMVEGKDPELVADTVACLSDRLLAGAQVVVLHVDRRAPEETALDHLARWSGCERGRLAMAHEKELASLAGVDDPSWTRERGRRRAAWRGLALPEGADALPPALAIGEALRVWRQARATEPEASLPVVVIPRLTELFVGAEAASVRTLERCARDHGALLICGVPSSREGQDPARAHLELHERAGAGGHERELEVRATDPRWRLDWRGEGRWHRACGRVEL